MHQSSKPPSQNLRLFITDGTFPLLSLLPDLNTPLKNPSVYARTDTHNSNYAKRV
jgi:hypothetical protein